MEYIQLSTPAIQDEKLTSDLFITPYYNSFVFVLYRQKKASESKSDSFVAALQNRVC